ncbi:MAG TPA: lipopolysaccharide transport periplasmic protein LptA [Beijerinckia sp.]|jgi:lipopolysaccharide export system protein LptA|nr:lipopolysaccharide transport periplasmic protein LptA [Beijerinckia sp.]
MIAVLSMFGPKFRSTQIVFTLCLCGLSGVPALAETAQSAGVLPGGNSKEPVHIEAGKLDYFDKEQKLVYTGNVVATQGDSRLKASTLVIFLTPKDASEPNGLPASSSQMRRMEAAGPVTLTSKDQVGTGDSGIYEKSENKVTLIGNVTLSQGPNVTKGDKLIYDLNTKQAVVTGRVRSLFLPNGSDDTTTKKPGKVTSNPKPEGTEKPQ